MSKCPFWSTNKEKVNCYNGCPMRERNEEEELCPFKEFLTQNKSMLKEEIDDELFYSQDRYSNYSVSGKLMNY